MTKLSMPVAYIGKEQAYVKHTILETYLQRLFMIVGQSKEAVINYVDCFAGPYNEKDEELSDTSIGVSLKQIARCQQSLKESFGRNVKFRALYIEKNPVAFKKLELFLSNQPHLDIDVSSMIGDYTELLPDIVNWSGGHFTFFFVDPTGWRKVISAKTMLPLLRLNKAEFLINLMYDFVNRFIEIDKHFDDMNELFGEVPIFEGESPEQRQEILLALYRSNMKKHYLGRTAYVTVEKPGRERVLYYLVYLTRHARGIDVFKAEAEKMDIAQRINQQEFRLRKQLESSGTQDLFGNDIELPLPEDDYPDNRYVAKEYLLNHLSREPTLIDYDKWADFLEDSDLYPTDFQMGIKELAKEGLVKNIDADISRRRIKFIRPDWPDKSERWVLI